MFLLTLRDLQYRAVRFLIAIVGTALVFAMVLVMFGLYEGFQREPQITIEAIGGADALWLVKEGSTGPFTSQAPIEARTADTVGVGSGGRADPVLVGRSSILLEGKPKDVWILGYEPGGLGTPEVVEGQTVSAAGQLVASKEARLSVGTSTTIQGQSFQVVGLAEHMTLAGGTPLAYMTIADAQKLVAQGRPLASAIVVQGAVSSVPGGLSSKSTKEIWEDARRPLDEPISSIRIVSILLFFVAATIIGAVVYLSALERVRDFAVMKAVGASSRGLLGGLTMQAVLIALVAALAATGLQAAIAPQFPLRVMVPGMAFVMLPLVAVFVGALASLGGLRKAVSVDPALAFAGPGG